MKSVRCAVYTRKSTEDGLEQEFNSLDAQREACEAYVLSQKHEGWTLLPDRYDDGGFSGGNIKRPGLVALLADIDAGLVDVIVVYKVDRLTRSLADFAKIVDRLDAKEASFVSVTQAFNTTTSMGRLTLNVLLSFAQFEREVTGERIRDKIAASKKKGLWMGGPLPLGYKVVERKLLPVPEEAERVRYIMQCYVESFSAPRLLERLAGEGVRTKIQQRASGPHRGGIPFARGSLFHLLKNPIYRGKIVHKGEVYDGEHEAIADEPLWDAVQERLKEKAPPRKRSTNDTQDALLKGLLTDPHGRPIVPTFTCKGSRRYRYYETRRDLAASGMPPATRFAMGQLDQHVVGHLVSILDDEHQIRKLSGLADAASLEAMFRTAKPMLARLRRRATACEIARKLISAISVEADHIVLVVDPACLANPNTGDFWNLKIPLPSRKPFRETKLRLDAAGTQQIQIDEPLVQLLRDAAMVRKLVLGSPELNLRDIAKREKRCRKQLTKLLRLSWLSPRIVEAIVDGRQPPLISRQRLLSISLPMDWSEQEKLLRIST